MQAEELAITIAAIAWIPLCFLVARAARSYQRSATGWFWLAFVFSPMVAYIFLLVADVPHKDVLQQQKEDRVIACHPDRTGLREVARYEKDCPNCGAAVNSSTGDGLHSSEGEPWRLLYDSCETEIAP